MPHSGRKRVRKILAHGHGAGGAPTAQDSPQHWGIRRRIGRYARKNLAQAARLEPKTDVVVFGQALHVKGNAVALFQQHLDGPAAETGANARARHLAGQRLPHDHVLAVHLGKLVQIVPGGELVPFARQRINRHLDQVFSVHQKVEHPQLAFGNHIFRVVKDEALECHAGALLKLKNGVEHIVQAVGFAGRPWTRADYFVDIRKTRLDLLDFALGLGIVRVGADEDMVVFVIQRGGRKFSHLADDAVLLPSRHHDGQRLFIKLVQRLRVKAFMPAINRQRAPHAPQPVHNVDEQIIQTTDQNNDRERQGQILQSVQIQ